MYGDGVHVVLAGHDRGARTMHRAAVAIELFPQIQALGVFMADIVPIVEEYAAFSNPNDSVGYFHWVGEYTWPYVTNILRICRHSYLEGSSQQMLSWHTEVATS